MGGFEMRTNFFSLFLFSSLLSSIFLSKCLFSSLLGIWGRVGMGYPNRELLPRGCVCCGPLVATDGNVMKLVCIFWAV